MRLVETISYPVSIFVAGSLHDARVACGAFCDRVGLCVTVTPTNYVYTHGDEPGVIVGLINYGRFPSEPAAIFARATELALHLIDALGQQSASIQAPDKTLWVSFRDRDGTATAAANGDLPGDSGGKRRFAGPSGLPSPGRRHRRCLSSSSPTSTTTKPERGWGRS
jgi:hypothetical protein